MVRSEVIYNRILCIDALLSFNGVIPSLPDFQLKLVTLIEQLNKSLHTEDQPDDDNESLCRVICCYLDIKIVKRLEEDKISWERYRLENYFYGYDNNREKITVLLSNLLRGSEGKIFSYASKLLFLLSKTPGFEQSTAQLISEFGKQTVQNEQSEVVATIKSESYSEYSLPDMRRKWRKVLLLESSVLTLLLFSFWYLCKFYLDELY